MKDPDAFDAFYKDARSRLLLQTYLLTGDLPAARSAVREAFTVAWHHWSKVSSRPEPESEVRPRAWVHAQRRHTARVWHREKGLDPEVAATLEALGELGSTPRRLLILAEVGGVGLHDSAREIGVTLEEAARHLAIGRAEYAVQRGVGTPEEVEATLVAVGAGLGDVRWPRPSILRRAGTRRRRLHTVGGIAVATVAVVASGAVVHDSAGTPTSLERSVDRPDTSVSGEPDDGGSPSAPPTGLTTDDLLATTAVEQLASDRTWTTQTNNNTDGDGLVLPCQQSRYADPEGLAGFVRTFSSSAAGAQPIVAYQAAEQSRSDAEAATTYETWSTWFGGCTLPRAQLVGTYAVTGVGDAARIFVLQVPGEPSSLLTAGIARTGSLTSTLMVNAVGAGDDVRTQVSGLLAAAVDGMCEAPGGGTCAAEPVVEPTLPVLVGDPAFMLSEVDLPTVPGVDAPWVGTRAQAAEANDAATLCDQTSFVVPGVADPLTRTFLVPDAGLPDQFGLTQTTGRLSDAQVADGFVGQVSDEMAACEAEDLATAVEVIDGTEYDDGRTAAWSVTVRVTEESTVEFVMGVARSGNLVSQIGFVRSGDADLTTEQFLSVLQRSRDRLAAANAAVAAGG